MATTQRSVRIDDETWEAYGDVCEQDQRTRSADLLTYIKWRISGAPGVRVFIGEHEVTDNHEGSKGA